MRVVGKRKPPHSLNAAAAFLEMVIDLHHGRPFFKKGVYRYKTFQEAQDDALNAMAGLLKSNHARKGHH